ncbi:16S rRNA processing protein RimM [Anaplasmataceae bacterium AB001_6]|nr:16S rRNA processing protein RimM [Anaplasmataceae bacterium AB001_6]
MTDKNSKLYKDKLIYIAHVSSTHGLEGAVKLRSYAENDDDIASFGVLYDSSYKEYKVSKIYNKKEFSMSVKFDNYDNIEDAQKNLVGLNLYIKNSQVAKEEDEFLFEELKSLSVHVSEKKIGYVKDVYNFGSCDILDIRTKQGDKMVPFLKENIKSINDNSIILYNLPEDI